MTKKIKTKYGEVDVFEGKDVYFLEGKSYDKFGIASGFKNVKDFERQYELALPHWKKFYPHLVHKPIKKKMKKEERFLKDLEYGITMK